MGLFSGLSRTVKPKSSPVVGLVVFHSGEAVARRGMSRAQCRQLILALGCLLPSLIGVGLYMIYSTVFGAYVSFTDYRGIVLPDRTSFHWVGFQNYVRVLTDAPFWNAFRYSVMFCMVLTPAQIGLALLTALGLNRRFFGQRAARISY